MLIGGLQKFSLLDYPGHLAAIIFTAGCNFRCRFCYNPMLVLPERYGKLKYPASSRGGLRDEAGPDHRLVSPDDLFVFLRSRAGKLDGVVVTGGEPTIHRDLPDFLAELKRLGLKVKLDTNGTNPAMLARLLRARLVDYLAMDLKAPLSKYGRVTGVKFAAADLAKIKKSVKLIKESGLPYEFRTTVVPGLIEAKDIAAMAELIRGADAWYLQRFKSDTSLVDKIFEGSRGHTTKELQKMSQLAEKYVKRCEVR